MPQSFLNQSSPLLQGNTHVKTRSVALMRAGSLPKISLPSSARGMAFDCTTVGFRKFCFAIACKSRGSSLRSAKVGSMLFDC